MDILLTFSQNVKHYRKKSGLSQETLAEESGLHRTYISDIECCRRSISLYNVQKIADSLKVDTYKLFIDNKSRKKQ